MITREIKNYLHRFIGEARESIADLESRIKLAEYLIAQSDKDPKAEWLPSFPTYRLHNDRLIQTTTVLDYLQQEEQRRVFEGRRERSKK